MHASTLFHKYFQVCDIQLNPILEANTLTNQTILSTGVEAADESCRQLYTRVAGVSGGTEGGMKGERKYWRESVIAGLGAHLHQLQLQGCTALLTPDTLHSQPGY